MESNELNLIFREHDIVAATCTLHGHERGNPVRKDTRGAIVDIYPSTNAYEVEFDGQKGMTMTVQADNIVRYCPEHIKVKNLNGDNEKIGEFIDWLGENGYTICRFNPEAYNGTGEYKRSIAKPPELIAKFYGIDLVKFDQEKEQMVKDIRAMRGD